MIVGALLGAAYGLGSIPTCWSNEVLYCDQSKVGLPRPDFLHPKHVSRLVVEMLNKAPSVV